MSWRVSGDRATHPLIQERRARPLRAPDRARQTQILSPRRPPGPGCSPYSEARGTRGTGRPRLASPHRILPGRPGPPRPASTTTQGPNSGSPQLPGPYQERPSTAPAAPLLRPCSREAAPRGRSPGQRPEQGADRDRPGWSCAPWWPEGPRPPAARPPTTRGPRPRLPRVGFRTSRIERPRSQGAVCGLRPERATPTPPPKARNSPAPAEPRLQRSRRAKPTGAARPEPGRFPEATPSHFRAALGRREDRALCDPAT
ncbi:basic proline-rich protein-like [Mustela erminea]|uniref:basic proline-rich protein-like n=1 Tax=Mustela erminea TaxID=36723 RepID=UPI001386AF1B|nr:basic proline-rich protein-like [Mustela erminea]